MKPENLDDRDGIPDEGTDFLTPGHPELFDEDGLLWEDDSELTDDSDDGDFCPECGYRYFDGECMCCDCDEDD